MDIRGVAYHLCKTVWKSEFRDQIRGLLNDINYATDEKRTLGIDRSHYGYTARHLRAQILGYLIVDRDKEKIQHDHLPISLANTLSVEEKKLLDSVHKRIDILDHLCIGEVINRLPFYVSAIDPYYRFRYSIPKELNEINLFEEEISKQLVQMFQSHPAIQMALETVDVAEKNISKEKLLQASYDLEKSILTSGVDQTPENLTKIVFGIHPNSPARITVKFFTALMCLRASLAVLNELIYQAILSNKLTILNEQNIISIKTIKNHLGGTGIVLLAQPDDVYAIDELGLVLLKDDILRSNIELCKIEAINIEISNDYGDSMEISLRKIDQNLNPYGNILQVI